MNQTRLDARKTPGCHTSSEPFCKQTVKEDFSNLLQQAALRFSMHPMPDVFMLQAFICVRPQSNTNKSQNQDNEIHKQKTRYQ